MTLFRQIYSLLLALFLIIIISISYFQFHATKTFLTQQMASDLNNTSTSLGLMLVPELEAGNPEAVKALIETLFDGGYYQQITLTWLVGGEKETWSNPLEIEDVPNWFISLNLFSPITKETIITSGWTQLAQLEITAHPGMGYNELWKSMSNLVITIFILFLFALIVARISLIWLLKPLNNLSIYAKNIAKRQFDPKMELPKTTELKEVVQAFNLMSAQLKKVFSSLNDEISALRRTNLVDEVSRIPNRQYLVSRLNSWLSETSSGTLFMVKMDWLADVHSQHGYQVRDQTIRLLAQEIQQQLNTLSPSVIARIAAYEFAFLVTDIERDVVNKYLQTLIRTINQEISKAGYTANEKFAIGIAERSGQMNVSDILAQADNALQSAISNNKIFYWYESHEQILFTQVQWRENLISAIENKKFTFRLQPIQVRNTHEVFQKELFCQLTLDNNIIQAGQFMPYIEQLSLGSMLDKCLLETLIQKQLLILNEEPIVINLTHQSLNNTDFHQWLNTFLKNAKWGKKAIFDIPEAAVYSNFETCQTLCNIISNNDACFGIDHFGRQFGSMSYLQKLRPQYVKLDQSFTVNDDNQHNMELRRALVNIAGELNIDVIATGIQNTEQLNYFKSLNIQYYMGFISPPTDVVF
ncbi:bifunctional diguanylate cyclase/phosphodiesterase [Shewanella surugensis]|uniref:EAL domain-containing protein n=1 Tax=Shewanella surugensis TaxID=212020 RepID=A0ABT0LIB6_9GAMM|nr:EAL domain-containing protein [Shewanella surugensis]MCL1127436.1 EAL domain-containing protein [Shewanella surugensis]